MEVGALRNPPFLELTVEEMLSAVDPCRARAVQRTPAVAVRPEPPDYFREIRSAYFRGAGPNGGPDLGSDPGSDPRVGRALGALLRAEYRAPHSRTARPEAGCAPEDLLLAGVRRAVRMGLPLDPEDLAGFANGSPALRTAASEGWEQAVLWHGRSRATQALRRRLLAGSSPREGQYLLEVAQACGLRPLEPAEAAGPARDADRGVRHAAWRYLAHIEDGATALPAPGAWKPGGGGGAYTNRGVGGQDDDAYERLLLAAVWGRQMGRAHRYAAPLREVVRALPSATGKGILLAQSMLLGRFDAPGAGLSGGLSVLLGGLGDALTGTEPVARVVTLVTAGREDLASGGPLIRCQGDDHWVFALPVDTVPSLAQEEMGEHRAALAWWAMELLAGAGARPDVVHVRYADDGSLAMAEAARRLGARLVFTVTADPHRTLMRRHVADPGRRTRISAALRHDLHRVFLADRMVARADGVVAIPGRAGSVEELVLHFPQLAQGHRGRPLPAPPEGITPYRPANGDARRRHDLLETLYRDGDRPDRLSAASRDLPVLLCVGRLHPVKQQDVLVKAWLDGIHQHSALVLVGGTAHQPTLVEREMRERIRRLLVRRPEAAARLAVLPAMSNRDVRLLQRALVEHQSSSGRTALYVCPSVKEEFGLAILEAMDAGMAVAAPRRGGAPHYVSDGVSGLLLDTSSADSVTFGLRRLLALPASALRAMAERGRTTVERDYSVSVTAEVLAKEYEELTARAPTSASAGAFRTEEVVAGDDGYTHAPRRRRP
ncbi:glycosyltransferase [Streptomyces sp. NPDC055749]